MGKCKSIIIFPIIDTFSHFVLLRLLDRKSSSKVATVLREVFAQHGWPIQWDLGMETAQGSTASATARRALSSTPTSTTVWNLRQAGSCPTDQPGVFLFCASVSIPSLPGICCPFLSCVYLALYSQTACVCGCLCV